MSEQPESLYALVEQWRGSNSHLANDPTGHGAECCAFDLLTELEAALKTWDTKLAERLDENTSTMHVENIRMRILGLLPRGQK